MDCNGLSKGANVADSSGTPCPWDKVDLVETGEGRTPRPESTLGGTYYRLSRLYCFAYEVPCRRGSTRRLAEGSFVPVYRRPWDSTPENCAYPIPLGRKPET